MPGRWGGDGTLYDSRRTSIRSDTGQDFQTAILEQASCGQPSTALVRSLGDEGGQLLLVQSKAGVTCAGSAAP
jgi:hypothetical protein